MYMQYTLYENTKSQMQIHFTNANGVAVELQYNDDKEKNASVFSVSDEWH